MTDNKKQNRLLNEKSPYLHQHAFNPVDWYPWGKEAFDKARVEDKPVFLSIGYSTCHWCHVMAHESFEDMDVAEILNRDYVSIKVDREERPDIDAVYMSVCQSMTGSGGWPLTIIMNADQKPFFAGTYFPKNSVHGRMGLMGLLKEVTRQWNTSREKLNSAGSNIVSMLKNSADDYVSSQEPSKELSDRGANQLKHNYDPKWGGFGMAPKFPTPHNLVFLMRYSDFENDSKAMEMAEKTLEQMYRGGMFDHVGGGFSRYSTDEKWLVPHFEKMLYDNALLTGAYIEAYRFTHRELYRIVAERTMAYVLRELTHPQGGFFCGQDADSEGVEGKYYVFTQEEIHELLGADDGNYFCRYYGITAGGNFEGKSIPNLIGSPEKETENDRIRALRQKVRAYREVRASLHKDDKILTSWNSLMIASLARASVTLGEPMYMDAAKRAQQFIAKNLVDKNGQLLVRWRDGEAAISGHLDDYAFYLYALLELYASTFDVYYFKEAIHFANVMVEQFFDKERGGFFLYASDGEKLISRPKEVFDGAMPSGNSVAALSLPRLAILSGDTYWTEIADKQLGFIASAVSSYPSAYTFSLLAIMEAVYPSIELVCTSSENKVPAELIDLLKGSNVQNLNVHVKTPFNSGMLSNLALYTGEYSIPRSGNLYYLCRNRACSQPVSRINELKKMLSSAENETAKRK